MTLYDRIGHRYAALRRPDPRIASVINAALGDAASVVNIGAGAGSYEPPGRTVLAIEPSVVMIRQRPVFPLAAPCVRGVAEALPVGTASVDASMAILSAHHWPSLEGGLLEMARIARKRAVLLTWAPNGAAFWLTDDYFPEIAAHDRAIFPSSVVLAGLLERVIGPVRIAPVPIPHDCIDGFLGAYWRRPECYLSAERRSAISSFGRINVATGLARLRDDLSSGRWAERNRGLQTLDSLDIGYRIVSCEIAPR